MRSETNGKGFLFVGGNENILKLIIVIDNSVNILKTIKLYSIWIIFE